VVLFVVAVVKAHFSDRALYAVAVVSGLTDMDAITLSAAKMFRDEHISGEVAWRMILIGMMANLVFKAGAVAVLGTRKLALIVAALFGTTLVFGLGLLMFWPDWVVELPSLPPADMSQ
jgi:uncharacterized membrane protein (DUF4010 family)